MYVYICIVYIYIGVIRTSLCVFTYTCIYAAQLLRMIQFDPCYVKTTKVKLVGTDPVIYGGSSYSGTCVSKHS